MEEDIKSFVGRIEVALRNLPEKEIQKAVDILHGAYARGGQVFVFGNGGSFSMATHWAGDFNKTIFAKFLDKSTKRFQVIRLPVTDTELTAWANDVGYEMIFAGPLQNFIKKGDVVLAISSSGNSENIIRAVEVARAHHVPIIGLSGFDGGRLNAIADAKIFVPAAKGEYGIVESVHSVILHLFTEYFQTWFEENMK